MKFIFAYLLLASFTAFADSAQVHLKTGWIEGLKVDGVEKFLGIPYAAPPVQDLRWKAPREPKSWSKVLSTKSTKSPCAQVGNIFSSTNPEEFGRPVGSEDCLYLNVWRPQTGQSAPQGRPIVLWIHGGSNTMGTASDPNYEGTRFSLETDSIFISANYRLGFFGSFYHPAMTTGQALDDSGNFVTLDLLKALDWIQANAEVLGGDPRNVTIMGQSAGCMNVWGLLQSRLAAGKFAKAVCLSGLPNAYPKSLGEARANALLVQLLLNDHLVADVASAEILLQNKGSRWIEKYLRSKTTEEILNIPTGIIPIQHLTDGTVIPENGFADLALGHFQRVPLILGSTADESTFISYLTLPQTDPKKFWVLLNSSSKNLKESDFMSDWAIPEFIAANAVTDYNINISMDRMCDGLSLYVPHLYRSEFIWKDLPAPWKNIFGSMHALDLMLLFGNFITDRPNEIKFAWTPGNAFSREVLHTQMISSFKEFFHSEISAQSWSPWNQGQSRKVWQ